MQDPASMTNSYNNNATVPVQRTSYDSAGFSDARGVGSIYGPTGYDWPDGFIAHGTGSFFDEGPYSGLTESITYGGDRCNISSQTAGDVWDGWDTGTNYGFFTGPIIGQPAGGYDAFTSEDFWLEKHGYDL